MKVENLHPFLGYNGKDWHNYSNANNQRAPSAPIAISQYLTLSLQSDIPTAEVRSAAGLREEAWQHVQ